MELGAVVLPHRRGEAAACDGRRPARGAALGHLDDRHTRLGALERGHGAGGAAADDEDVGGVTDHRNLPESRGERTGHPGVPVLAISTNASTHASANAGALMCSGSSSIGTPPRSALRALVNTWYSPGRRQGPRSWPARSCARRLVCSLKPSSGISTRTGPRGGTQTLRHRAAEQTEFLGVGPHQQILRVVAEEFAVLVACRNLAGPEIRMVDGAGDDHLRQAGGAGGRQAGVAGRIHAVDDEIGELVGGDVDDAGQIAGRGEAFERPATDTRGMELNHLVTQGFEPLADAIDTGRRAAERGDADQRRLGGR